jgi:hypothetical protein
LFLRELVLNFIKYYQTSVYYTIHLAEVSEDYANNQQYYSILYTNIRSIIEASGKGKCVMKIMNEEVFDKENCTNQ